MPELPEVESIRRSLSRAKLRQPIVDVWRSRKALRTGTAWRQENLKALVGATPLRIERRGKFLVWHVTQPNEPTLGWLVHLGMSGQFMLARPDDERQAHTHVVVTFADQRQVRFVDPRRFGGMRVATLDVLRQQPPIGELGPEPLTKGFDGVVLEAAAGRSKRALRDVLLDQRVVAGVGNIYANEALYLAGLHPLVRAERLTASAWARLADAVVDVLRSGLANGGTTLRDYRDGDGRAGRNQNALYVYGRGGQPCARCGATIEAFTLGGRGGALCPKEQVRPRTRRIA